MLTTPLLAVLSMMAATFGMLMSLEYAAVRNQSEYEEARQAAEAGYHYLLQTLDGGVPWTPLVGHRPPPRRTRRVPDGPRRGPTG